MIPMTPGDPTAANQELVLAGGDGRRWLACDVFFWGNSMETDGHTLW